MEAEIEKELNITVLEGSLGKAKVLLTSVREAFEGIMDEKMKANAETFDKAIEKGSELLNNKDLKKFLNAKTVAGALLKTVDSSLCKNTALAEFVGAFQATRVAMKTINAIRKLRGEADDETLKSARQPLKKSFDILFAIQESWRMFSSFFSGFYSKPCCVAISIIDLKSRSCARAALYKARRQRMRTTRCNTKH